VTQCVLKLKILTFNKNKNNNISLSNIVYLILFVEREPIANDPKYKLCNIFVILRLSIYIYKSRRNVCFVKYYFITFTIFSI